MVRFYPVRIITQKKITHVEIPNYRNSVGQD